MAPIKLTPIQLGDRIRLRKPHACGGHEWMIVRLGADIGLKCEVCGRRILLPRREFEGRLERVLTSTQNPATPNPTTTTLPNTPTSVQP